MPTGAAGKKGSGPAARREADRPSRGPFVQDRKRTPKGKAWMSFLFACERGPERTPIAPWERVRFSLLILFHRLRRLEGRSFFEKKASTSAGRTTKNFSGLAERKRPGCLRRGPLEQQLQGAQDARVLAALGEEKLHRLPCAAVGVEHLPHPAEQQVPHIDKSAAKHKTVDVQGHV